MQTMHLQSLRRPNIALPLPLFPSRFVQPAKWIHRRRSRRHCSCGWERARRMQMTSRESRPIDIGRRLLSRKEIPGPLICLPHSLVSGLAAMNRDARDGALCHPRQPLPSRLMPRSLGPNKHWHWRNSPSWIEGSIILQPL